MAARWRITLAAIVWLGAAAPVLAAQGRPQITGANDGARAWLVAEHGQIVVRKWTDKANPAVNIEVQHAGDLITMTIAADGVAVSRGGRRIAVNSPAAFARLQVLLGASPAVFAARVALSGLEQTSPLELRDMAFLSPLAFLASLAGDTNAPRRLADRFVEKHRGIFRRIREDDESCWTTYTRELTAAWGDLQDCMEETEDDGFFEGALRRLACNAVWSARSVSAELEYIKCLSPLTGIPK